MQRLNHVYRLNTKTEHHKNYFAKVFRLVILLNMKSEHVEFADRARLLAQTAGSQRKLAALVGVSPGTVTGWIGEARPYTSTLAEIAEKTGVSLDWLAHGDGNTEAELAAFKRRLATEAVAIDGPRGTLKRAREKAGLSYLDLGRRIGRDAGYLRALEDGHAPISEATAELLSRALDLSKGDLIEGSDLPRVMDDSGTHGTYGAKPSVHLPPGMSGRFVPILSNAQAGQWDADHTDGLYDYAAVFAPNVDDRRAFAIQVMGNSMEPELRQGDVVICSPALEVTNGDAAVVKTRSEQVFIKYWRKHGRRVLLESANPDYKPMDFPETEIAGAWPIVQHIKAGKITKQS